jgi:hypothetical protein
VLAAGVFVGFVIQERLQPLPPGPVKIQQDSEGNIKLVSDCAATFAAIGDYGLSGPAEAAVAELVHGWDPDFVVTTGDNNYPHGAAETIEENIGRYYGRYISSQEKENRFFPSLGNHDWETRGAEPYLEYFTLPGNERYYDVAWGPIHLFVIDSDPSEPDGISAQSAQASWLKEAMIASTLPWQVVVMHHPPYSSSSNHGSHPTLQWPFAEWGADAVLAGHDHVYEQLAIDGIPYIITGLGGNNRYGFGRPLAESKVRWQADYGALKGEANPSELTFSFYTQAGELIDSLTLSQRGSDARCGQMPAE